MREAAASWRRFREEKGEQAFVDAGGPDAIREIEQSLHEAVEEVKALERKNAKNP
ncbi:MAG: hypothetical protein WCC00_12690 [Candidatus Aminicenantales bacterium]